MYSIGKLVRTISLISAFVLAATTTRAVDPPPDGGYPNQNTAEGENALFSLTSGLDNTAIGFDALYSNTTGFTNTATGESALYNNTTGFSNTANGRSALYGNRTGNYNTATGEEALSGNSSGNYNTANGTAALGLNTTGFENTANGAFALLNNTTDTGNTANGGYAALFNNTTGSGNIALGHSAGYNLTTGSNNIDIGNAGVAAESGIIRIGTDGKQTGTYVAGIMTSPLAVGVAVIINRSGQLGMRASSARFKEAIKRMDKASEAILSLKPVTFHYKKELDPNSTPQFGLIAEEVAKVDPGLVVSDEKGKPFAVRYDEVNAMLLNEFLKEHHKVETQATKSQEQDATIAHLKSAIAQQQKEIQVLTASLKEQATQIQKVSDQLKVGKAAARVVANDQ